LKSIIVPVADTNPQCYQYLENLLQSMYTGNILHKDSEGPTDWSVTLCLDNVGEGFRKKLVADWTGFDLGCIDHQNPQNLNFCKNANSGLRFVYEGFPESTHFYLLNMDTVVPQGHLLEQVAGAGMSTPNEVDISEVEYAGLPHNSGERKDIDRAGGYCMVFSRELLDKVGFLDERFFASFEDDDMWARAKLAGFPTEHVQINVYHHIKDRKEVSNTGSYNENSLGMHLEIFRRKWSVPWPVPHIDFNKWIMDNYVWSQELKCI
jgi:hypothetical protein